MQGRHILLIIGGGIAAYKCLELIRLIRKAGGTVTPVLTSAAAEFVTPLSVSALAESKVYGALFDLTDEAEMGHIQLSRVADLVVVAPATADLMAKMAGGHADDLATTLLMATDTPVLMAPAMNVRMWHHPATQRNLAVLAGDGVAVVGPNAGDMACGEHGLGRMAEPAEILAAIEARLADPARPDHLGMENNPTGTLPAAPALSRGLIENSGAGPGSSPGQLGSGTTDDAVSNAAPAPGPLSGRRVLVTSGPTHEPIDPVRYIANRSSGAQGAAIAAALRDLGAEVVMVSGPATAPLPAGVTIAPVETASEMLAAVRAALPADAAVFAAAVADWRVASASGSKIKKDGSGQVPALELAENPDILKTVSLLPPGERPALVVGFAAETDDVVANAQAKRARKGCDWIVANDVRPETGIMGGGENAVTLVTGDGAEEWPRTAKSEVAAKLAQRIAQALTRTPTPALPLAGGGGANGEGSA